MSKKLKESLKSSTSNESINTFRLGSISVEVIQKDIQNIHLSVYPPNGRVKISAPNRIKLDTIRIYTISKLAWIKKQKEKFSNQERESKREFLERESHYFLGKRYLLKVKEDAIKTDINLKHNSIIAHFPPDATIANKKLIIDQWYREQLRTKATTLLSKWMKELKLDEVKFSIRIMKTKWGSCSQKKRMIWLNLELAKKPIECIEYILVHELVHLIERTHNSKFNAYMTHYLPNWRDLRVKLNKLPVPHVEWEY